MLYGFLRIVFWGIIFALAYFMIMRSSKIVRKKLAVILTLVLCMTLGTVSNLLPVENLFIKFKTPEDVFSYCENGKVDDIVYGKNSSMVIFSKGNNSFGYIIVPKSTKGYKIPSFFSVKHILHKFDRDGSFDVYNVLGSNDYYVFGLTFSKENEINITDSNNDEVKNIIVETAKQDDKSIFVYPYVENFTNEYFILINDKKITISN